MPLELAKVTCVDEGQLQQDTCRVFLGHPHLHLLNPTPVAKGMGSLHLAESPSQASDMRWAHVQRMDVPDAEVQFSLVLQRFW